MMENILILTDFLVETVLLYIKDLAYRMIFLRGIFAQLSWPFAALF